MKFKVFKWTIRLYDTLVALFLGAYFFYGPFTEFFDSLPWLPKALTWFGVVLFVGYSIRSWFMHVKYSLLAVLGSQEFKEAPLKGDEVEDDNENSI